jgi:hypothetical protein
MGPSKRSKVLILDMDETMLHAQINATEGLHGGDYFIPLQSPEETCYISVKNRPYLY